MSSEPHILAEGLRFPEGPVAMQDGSRDRGADLKLAAMDWDQPGLRLNYSA